ncbi:MAG: hypothetical protein U0636_09830 [Phycisphaerales bacterium]
MPSRNEEWFQVPQSGGTSSATEARERVVDALLWHQATQTRATVDARVARAMGAVEADAYGRASVAGRISGARWRTRAGAWGGLAAAVLVFGTLTMFNRPSTAGAMFEQARAAERTAGERRYEVTVELPAPVGQGGLAGGSVFMVGTLDIQDAQHIKLAMTMPDGKQMVRALNGTTSWVQQADGAVIRLPEDARWPRFIETPNGELLVDRLDVLLDDVAGNYTISHCGSTPAEGGASYDRVCATRNADSFRGPDSIELWMDPATHSVVRARMAFTPRQDGPGPRMEGGPRGEGPRCDGPPPRMGDGPRGGRPGARGMQGAPAPKSIVIKRVELPSGGYTANSFAPPSEPQDPPARGPGGPGGPDGGPDGPPPHRGSGMGPPPGGDGPNGPPPPPPGE